MATEQLILTEPVRVYWCSVRAMPAAWAHVRVTIAGPSDLVECVVCRRTAKLEVPDRTRQSIMRLFARIHFYRHRIGESVAFQSMTEH